MAKGTFEDMIEKERTRLNDLRNEAMGRRDAIDTELGGIDKELSAIAAYEAAKTGKVATTRASSGTRAPKGQRREQVRKILANNTDGLTPVEIIKAVGAYGDKQAESAYRQAILNMTKTKELGKKEGRYFLP